MRTCEQALEAVAGTGRAPLPTAGPAYVGLAEVAYQRNELGSARQHVTQGVALCRSFVFTMPLAAGLATLAWIRQAAGDPAGALDAMDEAAQAAQRSGGEAAKVPLSCLARLQVALGAQDVAPDGGAGGLTTVPAMIEQLTSRELEVLEMLAAGRSNQAIASQLVVTLDTVKKHVSHLLGKLGAANRTEAVARARQLGLIR